MTNLEDNPRFLLTLCSRITNSIKRDITEKEFQKIRNIIKNDLSKKNILNSQLVSYFFNIIINYAVKPIMPNLDIHEMLKSDDVDFVTKSKKINIKIDKLLNIDGKAELKELINKKSVYKRKIVILDSINQDTSIDCFSGKISWYINTTRYFSDNAVNFDRDFKNIVGMKLSPTRWEYAPVYLYMNDTSINRWTVCIEEFNTQSFIYPISQSFASNPPNYGVSTNVYKFHFMFSLGSISSTDSTGTYNYYDMDIKGFNEGFFWFDPPITVLTNKLTLSFGMPFNQFCIKSQKFTGLIGSSSSKLTITSVYNPSIINDARTIPLMTGLLLLDGFTTANPVTDINLINSINNHSFMPSYPVSPYIIQFNDIDLTGIELVNGSTMNCYTSDYRMIFQLEFIYLDD